MDVRDLEDYLLAAGGIWAAEHGAAGIAGGQALVIGFLTGNNPIVAMRRSYGSSGNLITISLYEVAFTGGSNIQRTYNRNQNSSRPAPMQMKAGVAFTPNTAIASLTARSMSGTGNASVTIPDEGQLILKKNASYVITILNADNGAADMGFQINFREQQLADLPV